MKHLLLILQHRYIKERFLVLVQKNKTIILFKLKFEVKTICGKFVPEPNSIQINRKNGKNIAEIKFLVYNILAK